MQDDQTAAKAIEARYSALFGYGWKRDFAEALEVRGPTITEQFSRATLPGYMVAMLELLESTHPAKWPARWSKLRDRAKAHAKKAAA